MPALSTASITFAVSELNIQLNTNVAGMQPFKRGMLKLPKMTDPPTMTSELPFFTNYVKYPSYIQYSDWKTRFEFFFNRDIFVDTLRAEIENDSSIFRRPEDFADSSAVDENSRTTNKTSGEWLIATEKENIMITLRSIFPIPEIFGTALKNSYEHTLMKTGNSRVVYDLDLKSAFNFFGFMYKFGIANKQEEDYFLNVQGQRYEIEDAVWQNDIVNHPTYSDFLKAHNETYEQVSNSKFAVTNKVRQYKYNLDVRLQYLNDTSKLKERYIYDVFKQNDGAQMIKEMKESCGISNKDSSVSADGKCDIDDAKFNDKAFFVKFFESIFSRYDEAKFAKYIYKNVKEKTDIYPNVKEQLLRDHLIDLKDKNNKFDVEAKWNEDTETEDTQGLIDVLLQELKNPETITGLIYLAEKTRAGVLGSKSSDGKSREIKNTMDRIIEKLNRLVGENDTRETGLNAANTILSINQDINNAIGSNNGIRMSDLITNSEYIPMFNKLVELATQVKGSSMVLDFVDKNKSMNLNQTREKDADASKTAKTTAVQVDPGVVDFIRKNFTSEYNMNNQLANSINNIYEPSRKTSNTKLYCLLRKIKTGYDNLPGCDKNVDASVFKRIYDYYMSEYPKRGSFLDIEPYLYTGVDQIRSNNYDEESSLSGASPEICVRLDLVEADKFEKVSSAPCKLFDSVLAEEYKHLTDKRYNDGSLLSTYRNLNLNFDSAVHDTINEVVKLAAEPKNKGGEFRRSSQKNRRQCRTKTLRVGV